MKYLLIALSSFIWISIAAITGGLFILKTYWHKLKAKLFSRSEKVKDDNDSQQA